MTKSTSVPRPPYDVTPLQSAPTFAGRIMKCPLTARRRTIESCVHQRWSNLWHASGSGLDLIDLFGNYAWMHWLQMAICILASTTSVSPTHSGTLTKEQFGHPPRVSLVWVPLLLLDPG